MGRRWFHANRVVVFDTVHEVWSIWPCYPLKQPWDKREPVGPEFKSKADLNAWINRNTYKN